MDLEAAGPRPAYGSEIYFMSIQMDTALLQKLFMKILT